VRGRPRAWLSPLLAFNLRLNLHMRPLLVVCGPAATGAGCLSEPGPFAETVALRRLHGASGTDAVTIPEAGEFRVCV
jgi:hypothetical protein